MSMLEKEMGYLVRYQTVIYFTVLYYYLPVPADFDILGFLVEMKAIWFIMKEKMPIKYALY